METLQTQQVQYTWNIFRIFWKAVGISLVLLKLDPTCIWADEYCYFADLQPLFIDLWLVVNVNEGLRLLKDMNGCRSRSEWYYDTPERDIKSISSFSFIFNSIHSLVFFPDLRFTCRSLLPQLPTSTPTRSFQLLSTLQFYGFIVVFSTLGILSPQRHSQSSILLISSRPPHLNSQAKHTPPPTAIMRISQLTTLANLATVATGFNLFGGSSLTNTPTNGTCRPSRTFIILN
jgi:hypothetical protein